MACFRFSISRGRAHDSKAGVRPACGGQEDSLSFRRVDSGHFSTKPLGRFKAVTTQLAIRLVNSDLCRAVGGRLQETAATFLYSLAGGTLLRESCRNAPLSVARNIVGDCRHVDFEMCTKAAWVLRKFCFPSQSLASRWQGAWT